MRRHATRHETIRLTARMLAIFAVTLTSMLAVQRVNAGSSYSIGSMPTMSSGAGLVLAVGLQRARAGNEGLPRNLVRSLDG